MNGFLDAFKKLIAEIPSFAAMALPLFLAIVLHEIAHGYAALLCGDATAYKARRLSLNPLRHVDTVGTVILPLLLILTRAPFMFGWAKPVPVSFRALNKPKRDMVFVALAGPAVNLVLALVAAGGLAYFYKNPFAARLYWTAEFLQNLLLCNLSLMLFNLIPVLPLDGGRVLAGLLPSKAEKAFSKLEKYGFLILVMLLAILPLAGERLGYDWDFVRMYLVGCIRFILEQLDALFGLG